MGKLNAGLAAYLAAKKSGKTPPSQAVQSKHPLVAMSPAMLSTIKASPKGKLPPGLARYMAAKRGKVAPKKLKEGSPKEEKGESASVEAMEKKLGVVGS